ncbi:MAG: hypothetical protein RIR33_2430 [Pseudomonadota bacterium]|jgi:hypothetical protein
MHIHVDRLEADAKATRGKLYIDGKFECYTLEDKHRDGEKVHGETRIPAGTYRLELYPHGTRFHPKYLEAYGAEFHKGMLRVCDVPGFDGVLIHKGNYHDDTEGCLLLGSSKISGRSNRDKSGNNCIAVGSSEGAYKSFYPKVRDALLRGETVTIEYSNSDVAARNATAVREQEAKSNAGVVAAATGVAGVAVVAGAASDLVGVDESGAAAPAEKVAESPVIAPDVAPAPQPAPAPEEAPAAPVEALRPADAVTPLPGGVRDSAMVAPTPAPQAESNMIEIGLIVVGVAIVVFALYLGYRRWKEWRQR